MENIEFVSLADHEAGFKIIEVTHRSGASERVKLTAPTRRRSRLIGEAILREQDSWPVVAACTPATVAEPPVETTAAAPSSHDEAWLDRLTPPSADLVEVTCFALTFGQDFQKKMLAAATLAMTTALEKPAPKSTSSAPATA